MFRRARFSVKPNVRPSAAGRGSNGSPGVQAAAPAPEAQHGSDPTTCCSVASSTPQQGAAAGDPPQDRGSSDSRDKTNDASSDGNSSKHAETVLQRRKRISTMPNLAKPRGALPSTQRAVSSISKCSQKEVPHSPTCSSPPLQKELPSPEKTNVENSPKSPILPEKKTPVPQVPQFSPFKKSVSKEPNACVVAHRTDEAPQKNTSSPLKERPTQERLIPEEIPQSKSAPAKDKRICSDHEKIIKTRKLRKMLKEELKKEKQQRKCKYPIIEKKMPQDRSKMIMRDFIYYLPENNPMKSSLVEEKRVEKNSTVTQAKEPEEKVIVDHEDENEEAEEEGGGEEEDGPLLVPRVKVAEDGSIILDEESLTVEVLRTKGQCVVEENDPIFERGSTTTYSSFRKSYYTKPWSEKETDMFFLAISMVGTDFSMISQLFPHRARTEIKNKFKREEKANGWRIDKAFKEKRPFDFDFFTKLLEKVLENEKRKKEKYTKCQKEKLPKEKKTPKPQKKRKAKAVDGQSNQGQDDHQNVRISDAEMELDSGTAEKENEESLSILDQTEGQTITESAVTKKKRKRKKQDSERDTDNPSEERIVAAEMSEEERSRKKRKNTSSSVEISDIDGEDLEVPDRRLPDEALPSAEEESQYFIQLSEETEEDAGLTSSSIQDSAFIEAESGELDISVASSEQHLEHPCPSTTREGFHGTSVAKNEIAELNKLDDNSSVSASSHDDDKMEVERAAAETSSAGQLQRLKSNLERLSEKRELPVSDTFGVKISPSEPLEKSTVEDKIAQTTGHATEEIVERTNHDLERELQACEKSSSQENSKQTVLKPAPLARGRLHRPKPNLGRVSRRREEPARNAEAEGEEAIEAEKTVMQHECSSSELLIKDTMEATTYEADIPHFEVLENKAVASAEKVGSAHIQQPPVKEPLERESCELKETSLSSDNVEGVSDLPVRDFSLQQEQKGFATELEHCLKSSPQSLKDNLAKVAGKKEPLGSETKMLEDKCEPENTGKSSLNLTSESSKHCDRDEAEKCGILPSSHLLEKHPTDVQDAVATYIKLHSPPSLSDLESGEASEVSLPPDIQEKNTLGKQSLKGESSQSAVRPAPLLRGRFQRPKPNIGRAVGRKEMQSVETNEATATTAGTEKLELPTSTRTSSLVPELKYDSRMLPAEALEDSLLDCEKLVQNDCEVLRTTQNISDQCARDKSTFQEDKPCTIKPAHLVRGRFQRARPNLGKIHGKKEDPASENIVTPVERRVERSETEVIKRGDLNPPSKDEVNIKTSQSNLGKKGKSESIEATSLERCIEQKKSPSHTSNLSEEFLKDQEGTCVPKDVERKHLNIPGSDMSVPQEITQTRSTKPTQLMRGHLQKPKPNITRTTKKKEASSEGDTSTEEKTERDTEGDMSTSGNKSINMSALMHDSEKLVDAASSSEYLIERKSTDVIEAVSPKRRRHSGKCEYSEQSLGSESRIGKEITKSLPVQERAAETLKRKQPGRTLKQRKNICDPRATCSTSECQDNHAEKGRCYRKVKPVVSRGRCLKAAVGKKSRKEYGSSKVNLVTLRASSQEEEEDDDGDDFEPDDTECFSPEEVNKAPVFVPKGLRSPNPVPVQIEETMEELEIFENVADESCVASSECLSHELNTAADSVIQETKELQSSQIVITQEKPEEKAGINDGSTEAAMTLLAMRDPVFQLNIITEEEKTQECPNQDELNIGDSFSSDSNEEKRVVHSNVTPHTPSKNELIYPDNMKKAATEHHSTGKSGSADCLQEMANMSFPDHLRNELVSSHAINKVASEDHGTSGLEKCSQEATRISSDLSSSKGKKTSKPTRCRFPKPIPKLGRGRGLNKTAPQKSLSLNSDVKWSNEIQNEENTLKAFTEEEKVELEQNLQLDELAKSNSDEHDLKSESATQAVQRNNTERENLITETWEARSELTAPKLSPKAETCPPDLHLNTHSNAQLPEKMSEPIEPHLSTADVVQIEASYHSSISATKDITTVPPCTLVVNDDIKEYSDVGEEPTFILTLVEIPADSEDCSGVSTPLQHISEDLVPAPVFPPQTNTELAELTTENSTRFTTTSFEENSALMDNSTQMEGLQAASAEHLADLGSTSWKNWKRKDLEGSLIPPEKKNPPSAGQSLKSFNKETCLKLRWMSRKADEESSEQFNTSEKKNSTTSNSVPEIRELQVEEREQPQSSLNVGSVLLGDTVSTDEQLSRTLHTEKAETSGRRSFVETCKLVQSEQVGSTALLPKIPLSRPSQRSLGFLPLICKKNNADEENTAKENEQSLQKSHIAAATAECECPHPTLSPRDKEEIQGNSSVLSTISSPSTCENVISSTVQVSPELSEKEGSSKEQEKEEEPTRISEYFFSDIFMEVDDSE